MQTLFLHIVLDPGRKHVQTCSSCTMHLEKLSDMQSQLESRLKFIQRSGYRCPMGTTDCSKLSQRSGEICYVAPDYANYEALEKWCGNWLFVIDEGEGGDCICHVLIIVHDWWVFFDCPNCPSGF
ncbi:hypothetical protein C1H46_007282 [Malus baccata]|uniref:Uncharacterized protein n=1 Tax=Malus baccata TaxID=106549 RepID=A0A540N7Q6_MALBA|nr:hypothetical protein C1H46_007282 [Malus baccata]